MADACQTTVATMIGATIFDDVVGMDNTWKYQPELAEKIPTLKDGDWKLLPGNKMQVTWKIRRGFTWHDGTPVTAQDWIWGWQVNMHSDFPTAGRDVARRVENISAPDPYTLVVRWKERYAFANLGVAGSSPLPKRATERIFRENPSRFDQTWGTGVPTVGNGPYILKEWQKGSSITVEANPNWKGTPFLPAHPAITRIIFRFISDTNTIIANVLSGAADATDETAIPFLQGLELEKRLATQRRTDIMLRSQTGLFWEHIDMNLDNFHLRDVRVRQALTYALNREELVQSLFEGKQPVSHTFLPSNHYGFDSKVKQYPYDPARARQLLAEAGYSPGPGGVMQKAGHRLSLTFTTTAGNRTREQVQQILQGMWKAVGIEVKIENQPARALFGDTLPNRRYDLAMYGWFFAPTADCEGLYTGDTIPTPQHREGQNYPGYRNDEVTRLCHAIPQELDEAKRRQMFYKVQELWTQDLPAIPLYQRSDFTSHKAWLQNWKPTGSLTPVTWNVTAWRWAR
jgi:peptide/nickel transport system substrate-binding protein